MATRLPLLLAGALLGVGACGDGPGSTGTDEQGTFQAVVTGDLSSEFEGSAVFGEVELSGTESGTGFVLALVSNDSVASNPDDLIVFVDPGERDLTGGSHALVEFSAWRDTTSTGDLTAPYGAYADPQHPSGGVLIALSEGGEVNLTEDDGRMIGTFDFPALGVIARSTGIDTVSVEVSGEFNAARGDPETAVSGF